MSKAATGTAARPDILDQAVSTQNQDPGAGCDFVIAQGVEAGGHVRGTIGVLMLLDEVLDAVDLPVLAAGGVATARGMAAVLAAGADGVRVGTRFLLAEESKRTLPIFCKSSDFVTASRPWCWPTTAASSGRGHDNARADIAGTSIAVRTPRRRLPHAGS
jgi:hypothetical protein